MKPITIFIALLATLTLQISQVSMAYSATQAPGRVAPSFPESEGISPSQPPLGTIDDSIANRLTIGMTDTEVFAFAGPPKFPVRDFNLASRWVYVVGDDVLELAFASGQIVQVKRFRQQSGGTVQ